MKATEQYFPVVLFNMLHKMVPAYESVDEILKRDHLNETSDQYFPVVLLIMLHKVIPTFESVDEILKCSHSNESIWAVFSWFAVNYAVEDRCNFWVSSGSNPQCDL